MSELQPTYQDGLFKQSPEKEKKKGKWGKIMFFGVLSSPILIFFLTPVFILFMAMTLFLEIDDTSLSEYGSSEIPEEYIPIYVRAGNEYGVDWILLAAIHKVETDFSQFLGESSVGAIGHTQFMICSWIGWAYPDCQNSELGDVDLSPEIYTDISIISQYNGFGVDANGNGKADPMELEDSIFATANYLATHLNGAKDEESLRQALYAYNHADWYVDEVLYYYDLYADGFEGSGFIAEIKGDKAWVVPYTKNITSHFSTGRVHPITGEIRPHNGIDIAAGGIYGRPAVAFTDGEVIYSQFSSGGYGYLVIIQHENNMKTYYAHLKQQGLPVGTKVKAGQIVGYIGSTGLSTGAHLHFEIRINDKPVDPLIYLSEFLD